MASECLPVKRAIEAAIQMFGFQDLVRVTRSDFSHIRGEFVVTLEFPEKKYHRFLSGSKQARAVTEGVMQDYERDYPGNLPAREP
jgi:hypothetical protein